MYQGSMKEMDGRRLYALLICWLSQDIEFRNIKTHVGLFFLQPLEHKGYKTISSKACNEWITGTLRSVREKVIHPAKGRRQE